MTLTDTILQAIRTLLLEEGIKTWVDGNVITNGYNYNILVENDIVQVRWYENDREMTIIDIPLADPQLIEKIVHFIRS